MEDDINLLFQKFIDNKINGEELERFYTYIERAETTPQIRQLPAELWAYVKKTSDFGQKSTVPLPAWVLVKLNSGSKWVFPKLFEGNAREVCLEGAAFFEIARDEERPLQVKWGDLITTVLGTSFNIRVYPDEQEIEVAIATGKVKVEKTGNERVGDCIIFGEFKNESLRRVMQTL